jgi:hypothetical protein
MQGTRKEQDGDQQQRFGEHDDIDRQRRNEGGHGTKDRTAHGDKRQHQQRGHADVHEKWTNEDLVDVNRLGRRRGQRLAALIEKGAEIHGERGARQQREQCNSEPGESGGSSTAEHTAHPLSEIAFARHAHERHITSMTMNGVEKTPYANHAIGCLGDVHLAHFDARIVGDDLLHQALRLAAAWTAFRSDEDFDQHASYPGTACGRASST